MKILRKLIRISVDLIRAIKRPVIERYDIRKISKINVEDLVRSQVQLFDAIGLDWTSANQFVCRIYLEDYNTGSHRSQHFEVFAALGSKKAHLRILEIGTGEAGFSAFLSRAFPDAEIETIDLPIEDKRFWSALDYKPIISDTSHPTFQTQIKARDENLLQSSNVNFREMNSLALSRLDDEPYDLIWVDGDHTFPIVACDIANAVRLLKPKGTLVCDDVFLVDGGTNGGWGSQETQRTLEAFDDAKIFSTKYVLKSLLPRKNFNAKVKKHLSVSTLV